jgi:nickel transport protein
MTNMPAASVVLLLLGSGILSSEVQAHKVNMFAFAEGNQVFVEGYFSDGKRARNSEVIVYGSDGERLVRGVTDDEGAYTFDIPSQSDLRITLNAGMGHMTEDIIASNELSGSSDSPVTETAGVDGSTVSESGPVEPVGQSVIPSSISKGELKKAVGEAIRPLMRSISELEERRSFSDIVGGLGFIVGIAGIFFYVKARSMLNQGGKNQ